MSSSALPAGKLPSSLLREVLQSGMPPPPEVRLPPMVGEDAGVIDVPAGALIVTTDPITLTGTRVAPHCVTVNANDVAVMGVRPRWFLCAMLLPPGTTADDVRAHFRALGEALEAAGVALVGGHTEITTAVTQPVVVGQMLGLREDGRFWRSGGVRAGDVILQVGPAPIEGAAVLAVEAEEALDRVDPQVLEAARQALSSPGISVVDVALRAADLEATALHDPTEGGLSAGLHEMAEASGLALVVDTEAVLWFAPGRAVCEALGADPWGVLASGTLLAAFSNTIAAAVVDVLRAEGLAVAVIARAEPGAGVRLTSGAELPRYETDEVARLLAGAA